MRRSKQILQEERAAQIASYIIENGATVRAAASKFGISKSTVHNDVTIRLRIFKPILYQEVKKVLDFNKNECAKRGGLATQRKYKGQ